MISLLAQAHNETGSLWEQYTHLITDPAHLMLEATLILLVDGLLLGLAWPLIKRWVRRHDEQHHHGHMSPKDMLTARALYRSGERIVGSGIVPPGRFLRLFDYIEVQGVDVPMIVTDITSHDDGAEWRAEDLAGYRERTTV